MKISKLSINNFMRISAIEIAPNSDLVRIVGRNAQGKSSILQALWAALAGKDACPAVPIRSGQERAKIRLDLGELIITRTFSRSKDKSADEYTTAITVESGDGARYPSPQKMLDALIGSLSFDPLAFARMRPREQFDALRQFVPTVDFDAIEKANLSDRERRTELNRLAQQERGAALATTVPEGTPAELVDEDAIVAELARAGEHNSDVEKRRQNREAVSRRIEAAQQRIASLDADIETAAQAIRARDGARIAQLEEQIAALQRQVVDAQAAMENAIEREAARLREGAEEAQKTASELSEKLAAAGELPAPIDTAAVARQLEEARTINVNVRRAQDRARHERLAEDLEKRSEALTEAIEARNAQKRAAIAAAKMPVDGIGFGDGIVLLNGVPFEQGSDAEQLRASVAIAMALNPKLRVIRVRDGSLLDENSLKILEQMCADQDFQCWIEIVDSDGKTGFVIEDGQLKAADAEAAA